MITTSANYKTAIKAVSREIRAYLKFNGSTIYRGVDGLVSINWNAQLFDKERFCVNCANAAYIEAEMYGEPIQNLESAYVEAFIGVVLEYKSAKPSGSIEDDTADVEYVKIGRFDVTEVVRKNGKVMISAYDRMAKLSENYVTTVTPTDSGYSKSAIVTDIKNKCGLTWTQSFSGYVPEIINSTMRDQLCWLYGSTTSTGQSLMLSRDGTTVISKVIVGQTALNYTIDDSTTYLDGLNDQPTFTITSYTANAGESTYSYGSGAGVECYNPYITSTIASNTYNFIKNFSYTPMTLEFRGDPAIELGDILTVTSGNNSYSVVVMKMSTVFNGGLKTTINCYGNTEEWDAISNSPTGARIIQTENMVRIEASRASEAEGELQSAIEANAEAITLRATKEEAQGYASDAEAAAKSYADSQISVSASGILSTVSQTYQTQANAAVVNLLPNVYTSDNTSGKDYTSHGIRWVTNNDGSITATATGGARDATSYYYLTAFDGTNAVPWIPVDPTKKYTASGGSGVTGCAMRIQRWDASKTSIGSYDLTTQASYTTPVGASYIGVTLYINASATVPSGGVTWKPMLEIGDAAHAWVSTYTGTNALTNRMANAESEISQNAHDITLKVSESDVTGNYVIGKINLNSTTATIAAEHINLQGAVSISSFNNATKAALLTGTAVKNQYYISTSSSSATGGTWADTTAAWSSGKYVWTRVVTTKTYADGTSTTTNGTAVYDANLTTSLSTGASAASTASSAASAASSAQTTANTAIANTPIVNLLPSVYYRENLDGKTWTNSGITWTVNADGSVTATGTASGSTYYGLTATTDNADVPRIPLDSSRKYTVSGAPGVTGCVMLVSFYDASGALIVENGIISGSYTKPAGCYFASVRLRVTNGAALPTGGATFKPMLEVGDTAHAYVSTHNGSGAVNRQEQLIYRSAASGTTTMSGTTTWVTDVTGGQNTWTAVRPQYSQTYPVLFIATQRQTMGGTVTCTTPKIDETTTVIDGGHIITGTIDANKITANSTFTQKLYASDFNLTGGTININTSSESTNIIQLNSPSVGGTSITSAGFFIDGSVGFALEMTKIYIRAFDNNGAIWNISNASGRFRSGGGSGGDGSFQVMDSADKVRGDLTPSGLEFRNSSDAVTASYPATGFPVTEYSATWTCTTSWSEALSFTLDPGDYLIEASQTYNNGRPSGIGFAALYGTIYYWYAKTESPTTTDAPSGYTVSVARASAYVHVTSAFTLKVLAKTTNASKTNPVKAVVKKIP